MTDPDTSFGDGRTVHWDSSPPAQDALRTTPPNNKSPHAHPHPSIGACDACRARKVRCLASDDNSSKCQRCARAGRECVYTVHSKTRRRKRTDTRVKELEEKVKNLSMLLEQGRLDGKNVPPLDILKEGDGMDDEADEEVSEDGEVDPPEEQLTSSGPKRSFSSYEALGPHSEGTDDQGLSKLASVATDPRSATENRGPNLAGCLSPDVVDRGVVDMGKAQELVDRYIDILSPEYPAVVFPTGTQASELRSNRPILFLAIIAAAAGNQEPAFNLALNQEILQVYAQRVALKGEKSLDLIQSMLISILWYYPPDRFEELKFHQYIHMASTMALDIGLGKRPRPDRSGVHNVNGIPVFGHNPANNDSTTISPKAYPDSSTLEARRTLLACYLSCSSASVSLRLPNMLRFTSWMDDCLNILDTSLEAAPTDKRFVAWIRMQRLVEECNLAFNLDDPGSTASLADFQVQQTLRGYERQLEILKREFESTPGVVNDFMSINIQVNNLYIHEIALHPEHDSEDFRPPFFVTTATPRPPSKLGLPYVNAISACVSSAQTVLKDFSRMSWETIRGLPAFLYARVLYCVIVLIKLDISIDSPVSEIGKFIDHDSLETGVHVDRVLLQMRKVAGTDNKCIMGAKFYIILGKLVGWYHSLSQPGVQGTHQTLYDPARAMNDLIPKDTEAKAQAAKTIEQKGSQNPFTQALTSTPLAPMEPLYTLYSGQQNPAFTGTTPTLPRGQSSSNTPNGSTNASNETKSDASPSIRDAQTAPAQAGQSQGTPATDYSSPEMIDGPNTNKLPYDFPMEADASMFNQLEGADPFSFNQDPNDWMFDGMDYSVLENVEGLDWNTLSAPNQNQSQSKAQGQNQNR